MGGAQARARARAWYTTTPLESTSTILHPLPLERTATPELAASVANCPWLEFRIAAMTLCLCDAFSLCIYLCVYLSGLVSTNRLKIANGAPADSA